jgi:hypothetical protein
MSVAPCVPTILLFLLVLLVGLIPFNIDQIHLLRMQRTFELRRAYLYMADYLCLRSRNMTLLFSLIGGARIVVERTEALIQLFGHS